MPVNGLDSLCFLGEKRVNFGQAFSLSAVYQVQGVLVTNILPSVKIVCNLLFSQNGRLNSFTVHMQDLPFKKDELLYIESVTRVSTKQGFH